MKRQTQIVLITLGIVIVGLLVVLVNFLASPNAVLLGANVLSYVQNGTLHTRDLGSGTDAALTTLPDGATYSWSRDRRQIIYVEQIGEGNLELFQMFSNGEDRFAYTDNLAADVDPAFSPDGFYLAFASAREGNLELYILDANGSNYRRMTDDPGDDYAPAWSRDNRTLLFVSERGGSPDIYRINAPTWAPWDNPPEGALAVTPLITDSADDVDPTYAPDDQRIAFASNRSGTFQLYISDNNGERLLVETNGDARSPEWSPDGTTIAFECLCDGRAAPAIYAVNADGTNLRLVAENARVPRWLP